MLVYGACTREAIRAFRPICGASLGPRRSGLLVSIMRLIGDGSEGNFLDNRKLLGIKKRNRSETAK